MSDNRAEILKQYKEHKLTSVQAIQKLKTLDRENLERRRGKKTGGKRK